MQAVTADSEGTSARVWLLSEILEEPDELTQDVQSQPGTELELYRPSTEGVRAARRGGRGLARQEGRWEVVGCGFLLSVLDKPVLTQGATICAHALCLQSLGPMPVSGTSNQGGRSSQLSSRP